MCYSHARDRFCVQAKYIRCVTVTLGQILCSSEVQQMCYSHARDRFCVQAKYDRCFTDSVFSGTVDECSRKYLLTFREFCIDRGLGTVRNSNPLKTEDGRSPRCEGVAVMQGVCAALAPRGPLITQHRRCRRRRSCHCSVGE
ncbi:hypothetical protein J6590_009914 [Homalodisca vitripennis]|nr:hypothetical protein J6590_009914 [Homalodisca vitripennis]